MMTMYHMIRIVSSRTYFHLGSFAVVMHFLPMTEIGPSTPTPAREYHREVRAQARSRATKDLAQSPWSLLGLLPAILGVIVSLVAPALRGEVTGTEVLSIFLSLVWASGYFLIRAACWEEKIHAANVQALREEIATLNKKIEKRLHLKFDANDPNCFGPYRAQNGKFVHVFTHNTSAFAISNCLVEVTDVEACKFDGTPIDTPWHVALPVSWCNWPDKMDERKYQPISLPPGIVPRHAVDVVSGYVLGAREKLHGWDLLRLHVHPAQVAEKDFHEPGIYKFLIQLHSTDATSAWLRLTVNWTGNAMEMTVASELVDPE